MAYLQPLARQYSDSALKETLRVLDDEARAIQRRLMVSEPLDSGNAPSEIAAAVQKCLKVQAATVADNYSWAIREAPHVVIREWVQSITTEAVDSLLPLFNAGTERVSEICKLVPRSQLLEQLLGELQAAHISAQETVRTATKMAFAERSQCLLQRVIRYVTGLLSRAGGT